MSAQLVTVPGRANLIGEHIDYHGLSVLPIALRRSIRVRFTARADRRVHARSCEYGDRSFEWQAALTPVARGDWENYLRAAAQTVSARWGLGFGIDAEVTSDLPAAAGLSSSSALLVAFTLALLRANGIEASFEELMAVLPEGEQFVGTRGGGMDHAAVLGSRQGCASLVGFDPVTIRHVPIPGEWAFLVADSMQRAEKSGAIRERYNAIRAAGTEVLRDIGFASYSEAMKQRNPQELILMAKEMDLFHVKQNIFEHVVTEAFRVHEAVAAMGICDAVRFGQLLLDSHFSLRDRLQVSCPALDTLVDAAMSAGALGARLTGAGFGGCVVIFCLRRDLARVRAGLPPHIIEAEPGAGAVHS